MSRDIGAGCGEALVSFVSRTEGGWVIKNKNIQKHKFTMWVSFNFMYGSDHKSVQKMKVKGLEFFEEGKYKKAKTVFDNYLQNYTYDPEIIRKRALCFQQLGKTDLACKDINLLRLMGELKDQTLVKSICKN